MIELPAVKMRPPNPLAAREGPTAIGAGCVKCHAVGKPNHCPHCKAADAEVISLFGTQAMTLQYRCRKCGTVFEAIKYG